MAYDDLRSFLKALEKRGQLKRVQADVDPHLEIGEITDRVQKAPRNDPHANAALLFENVRGRADARRRKPIPLAMNVYGTEERLCLALGLESLDEIGDRIGELLKPELPRGLSGLKDALGKAAQLKSVPPKNVKKAPCQEVVLTGDDVDLDLLPGAAHLARGRRLVLQPGADAHQAPGDRRPEPRPVPAPAPGQAHHHDALADPQGLDEPLRRGAAPRRAAAGRRRLRLPAGRHLRRDRAAALGHRRVPVRRVRPGQAGRARGLQDRAAAGAGERRGGAGGLAGAGGDAGRRARSATTPASTRRSSRSRR